jgi:hypothetical protein
LRKDKAVAIEKEIFDWFEGRNIKSGNPSDILDQFE